VTRDFSTHVQATLVPLLADLGFVLDEIDDTPDNGGHGLERHIVFFRSVDCKIQVYDSSREGEINCMIAPLAAPNEFGLNSGKWYYISYFSKQPDLPPEERLRLAIAEVEAYDNKLDWVKDRIIKHYETARAGILDKFGSAS
jgi:hypothetical protein